MPEPVPPMPVRRSGAERVATAALVALGAYLLVVLGLGATVGPVVLTMTRTAALGLAGAVALHYAIRAAADRGLVSAGTLLNLALLSAALLVSLFTVDLGVSAYLNLTAPPPDLASDARNDKHAMAGEWYPRHYFPTTKNFRVHKPGFSITGAHYGGFYRASMLDSPTLVDSVLDRRQLTIHINELGFRETSPLAACEIFALGDSFTFGWGVTEGAIWPDLLEQSLGTCVYNLGVNDASPKQELLLLEHLLSRGDPPPLRRLVWAIYEGNDLEDSYADGSPVVSMSGLTRVSKGTVLATVPAFLDGLHTQSLVQRLRTGQLRLRRRGTGRQAQYTVDGVRLVTPLYHSPAFGYMMLESQLLDRAARPEAYVTRHPHRRQLRHTFARMRHLGDSLGFGVTVVIVPTSVRLYAPYYRPEPAPSAEPHFVNHVAGLARAQGFDVVDLLRELEPHARTELLYFRDDDHFNPRGHEVVAGILDARLRADRTLPTGPPGDSGPRRTTRDR